MQFMVEGTLKHAHAVETRSLIPAEVARGNEVQAQGLRKMIYVAADFPAAWQVYQVARSTSWMLSWRPFPAILHQLPDHSVS